MVKLPRSVTILSTHKSGGGAAVAASNLCDALMQSQVQADLLFLDICNSRTDWLYFYSNILMDRAIRSLFFRSNRIFHSTGLFGALGSHAINLRNSDLVHAHWTSNGLIGLRQLAKIKAKLVLTAHDSWLSCGFEHHPCEDVYSDSFLDRYLFALKKVLIANCSGIIFPSKWQQRLFIERFGRLPRNTVIPNIVNPPKVTSLSKKVQTVQNAPFVIGVCCQRALENPAKGSEVLLELLNSLNTIFSKGELTLLLAGKKSSNYEAVRVMVPNLQIIEIGAVDHDEIGAFYSQLDLFLNFSEIENLSTTLIESAAHSVPSVAFDVGGNAEIVVNMQTGLLLPAQSPNLCSSVVELINNHERLSRMKSNSYSLYLEKFSPQSVLQQHMEFYNSVF
jgi:glycosyltransferase involved in cell wall biosynthesis